MSFYAGQRVRVTHPTQYTNALGTVKKVLPKNVDIVLDNGKSLRVEPTLLSADLVPVPIVVPLEPLPPAVGTVVTLKARPDLGLHVVIGDYVSRGGTKLKVAKLGGDDGKYWKAYVSSVEVVTLEELARLVTA